jgi:hypothetical protein
MGIPGKKPGFRHNQREQNEWYRSDASRVVFAPHTWECHIQTPVASVQKCRLWDAERFYLPTAKQHGKLYCFFLSEEPVLRMFTILEINKASGCRR